jgi:cytochrome P450
LSVADSLSLATQIMIAGVDTVVNFLGFVILLLARDTEARQALAGKSGAELTNAVQELFRRFGVVSIARTVRDDMEFHGVSLKKGELVCVPTVVHGLDERVNPDPMRVDFTRKAGRHSAFGSGPHMCPGAGLARKEIAITIEEWLRRIPDFRVAAESDLTCSGGIVAQINRIVLEWEPRA